MCSIFKLVLVYVEHKIEGLDSYYRCKVVFNGRRMFFLKMQSKPLHDIQNPVAVKQIVTLLGVGLSHKSSHCFQDTMYPKRLNIIYYAVSMA